MTTRQLVPQQIDNILDTRPDLNRLHSEIENELSKFQTTDDWLSAVSDNKFNSLPDVLMTLVAVMAFLLILVFIYWWCARQEDCGK